MPGPYLRVKKRLIFPKVKVDRDRERFDIDVIHQVTACRRRDARALETALHTLFWPMRFRPPVPLLSGGKTECFTFSLALEGRMKDLIASWNSSAGRALAL